MPGAGDDAASGGSDAFTDSLANEVLGGSGFLPTLQPVAAELPNGHLLHEYRIESLLGCGGFGLTYLARDTLLDCRVALKEFAPRDVCVRQPDGRLRARTPAGEAFFVQGRRRFVDEARALAGFRHSHIVRVNRYFEANDTAYLVMEFEHGLPLGDWVRRHGRLERPRVLDIVRALLDGVETIHGAGLLHRDIKPANILMRDDGTPVLLDFGAARRFDNDGATLTSIVTPGYAPHEQYHSHGVQGPWTDLYALGAVMYWLVVGERPVESVARVPKDLLVPATRAADAGVWGKSLLRAIDWALEPDAQQRPRSVADFRRAFMKPAPRPAHEQSTQRPPSPDGVLRSPFDAEQLRRIEAAFARHVGPLARVLVPRCAREAGSVQELLELLAQNLPGEPTRNNFLDDASRIARAARGADEVHEGAPRSLRPSGPPPAPVAPPARPLDAAVLERAEKRLARYLGPMARIVVARAAPAAADAAALHAELARHIDDARARSEFLDDLSGPPR